MKQKARIAELRVQTKKDGKTYMTFHLDGEIRKLGMLTGAWIHSFHFERTKISLKFNLPRIAPPVSPVQKAHLNNMADRLAASLNEGASDE